MKKITALLLLLLLLTGCTTATPIATEPTVIPTETICVTIPAETEAPTEPTAEGLFVHFIDVGQADCALIACNGSFALIDGGNAADGQKVVSYLEEQGVDELDLVVGTHPHEDHIGSLPHVLKTYTAETIWSSEIPYSNINTQSFLNAAADQNVPVQVPEIGEVFELGDATITVLGPIRTNHEDVNNISLVLMVQYGDVRFLMTGDMEREAEEDLLAAGTDVKADVLKVGHHGSYSSTSYHFLREVAPTYGVISVGGSNEYGHPHTDPMSRLRDAEVIVFRTDRMYDIVAYTDGTEIEFTWDNTYAQPGIPKV